MPELPEVETVVRGLKPDLIGREVSGVWVGWPKVLGGMTEGEFIAKTRNARIEAIHRRGKYICLTLTRDFLVIHLRMTGRLYLSNFEKGEDKWVHFSLAFADGSFLAFSDARKFGRVLLRPDLQFLEEKLGPEPLEITAEAFRDILSGSSRAVKTFLLDQKKIAGIGNIYADESLFVAGINPHRPVNTLSDDERVRLGAAVIAVLKKAVGFEGASINWYRKPDGGSGASQEHFYVYGRTGQPCLTCGTLIKRVVLGQRGTHFCPDCQKG